MLNRAKRFTFSAIASILLFSVGVAQEPQPFPAGVYTFEITAEELPQDVPSHIRPLMIGKYVVTFTANGRVKNVVNGNLDAEGHYVYTPDHLVITDEKGPGQCQAERATGIYRWKLDVDKLKLEAVDDKCRWRQFAITLKGWKRQK